ncbi:magnesium transporter NIPA7 [Phlyctema vagabunda]|uniref:Magnesium transporter NIPA7 n=1 Tax=Phlyctema vagabunda TaxID=108571 RepID=A0ABR4P817_9HELO
MYLSPNSLQLTATPTFFTAPTLTRAAALSNYDTISFLGNGDSNLQRWSSFIGITTAIIGNILISFALNIQRYAHIRLHKEQAEQREKSKASAKALQNDYGATDRNGHDITESGEQNDETEPLRRSFQSSGSRSSGYSDDDNSKSKEKTYLSSPYWWGGIVLMTVGEAGNFLAYGFAPASIVSPLGVVALISNCVIAPIMLKERFRLRDFWGVLVAVGGAVTVVLSAKQEEKKFGPHEIWDAITTTEFEVYMGITAFLMGVLIWASPRYGNKTILVDLGLVGLFGGYTALSTKGVASMLSSTLWRALTTPVTYALVAVLVSTAVMQVKYVNKALQRFDSTQVIPVQFVMFTLSVIIGSAILYGDFYQATAESIGKFIGGCLLTFFGVFLITSGRDNRDDDEDEGSDEEDEQINLAQPNSSHAQSKCQDDLDELDTSRGVLRADAIGTGDATNEVHSGSRRSSHVSFADSAVRPGTSQLYSSSSLQPSVRLTTPEGVPESALATETSPLLANPWRNPSEELLVSRHPGMLTCSSSPLLPSEAHTSSTDSLRPASKRASSQANFHTHPNQQQGPAPPQAERPVTPIRNPISKLMPGPLLSPLSGGLSVVVADSLRRGVDSHHKTFKRLRRSKSQAQRLNPNSEDELGSSPLRQTITAQELPTSKSLENETATWSKLTRARSLSNTLGDLFRVKRQKTDSVDDDEAGPSRS